MRRFETGKRALHLFLLIDCVPGDEGKQDARGTWMRPTSTSRENGAICIGPSVWTTHLVTRCVPVHRTSLGRGKSGRAVPALLQGAQTCLRASLMQHMREKLLKGEQVARQSSQGQGFDGLLLQQDLHAALRGIQVQDDAMPHQLGGDVSLA